MFVVDRKTITMQFGTWTLWKLGYADRAAQLEEEMSSHARRLTHANSLAQALTAGASVYMLRREPDILLSRVAEGIAVAQAHGFPVWIDHVGFWIGWAIAEKGFLEEGIAHLRTALDTYRRNGAGSSLPKFYGLLADRLGEQGDFKEALGLVDQALAHIEQTEERANEAETGGCAASCCLPATRTISHPPRFVCDGPSTSLPGKRPRHGNCVRQRRLPPCCAIAASGKRRASALHPCMTGSTKAWTHPTCSTREGCCASCHSKHAASRHGVG
jgi:tetratricopeptide (TPR) repeat protein